MKKLIYIYVFIFLLNLALISAQKVDVGLYVLNLGKFDVATGSFTADFYLSMKCDSYCSPDSFEFREDNR